MSVAHLRPRAEEDLIERTGHYRREGGTDLAVRFFDEAEAALRDIERMPRIGSLRFGELCDVPGLRSRRIAGFPCGWFYFVHAHHLDVVRLLSDAQDLAVLLGDGETD